MKQVGRCRAAYVADTFSTRKALWLAHLQRLPLLQPKSDVHCQVNLRPRFQCSMPVFLLKLQGSASEQFSRFKLMLSDITKSDSCHMPTQRGLFVGGQSLSPGQCGSFSFRVLECGWLCMC
eukprot:6212497-Pleurochrysis_carterae.AAC.3